MAIAISEALQSQLNDVPKLPGVYLFSDHKKKLLYVGKASVLRNRVRSYFQNTPKGPRIQNMVNRIASLQVIVTQTEAEALLLENSLIKNNKPYFNVLLRDDKTYPYIKVTQESFPRVLFTRRRQKDGAQYFGPFPSARVARQSINLIHKHFKIRNCDLELGTKAYRPCLQYHIKRCDAPCDFRTSESAYQEGVERAALFLDGKTDDLVKEISQDMEAAAKNLAYERAAYFRDLLGMVTAVQRRQTVASLGYDKLDIVVALSQGWKGSILIMAIRNGTIVRTSQFSVDWEEEPQADLANWLTHYYLNHADPPAEVVVEDGTHLDLLSQTPHPRQKHTITVTVPQRGAKKRLIAMAQETLRINLEMQRSEGELHPGVEQLTDLLELSSPCLRMECFDISNTMGQLSVASMVSFLNGKPDKRNYRKFNIKTVTGPDDFASIAEAVGRRYRRLLDEGTQLPDLIVIDGGLGQLRAAHQVLMELGMANHPLISLAKREEWIHQIGTSEPLVVDHHQPALKLMQHIRDEAHRFGITAHRKKRGKTMLDSELDAIPGLGPTRIRKLLLHFGSVKRIRQADPDQLAGVVGKKTAANVISHLRKG